MKKLVLALIAIFLLLNARPTAEAQASGETARYTFVLSGNKAGFESSTRNADGSLQIHFEFNQHRRKDRRRRGRDTNRA
jgi:hypothetical protein